MDDDKVKVRVFRDVSHPGPSRKVGGRYHPGGMVNTKVPRKPVRTLFDFEVEPTARPGEKYEGQLMYDREYKSIIVENIAPSRPKGYTGFTPTMKGMWPKVRNRLSLGETRQALEKIRNIFPKAELLAGTRETGLHAQEKRAHNVQKVNLKSKPKGGSILGVLAAAGASHLYNQFNDG
jgi:hypothetical protein